MKAYSTASPQSMEGISMGQANPGGSRGKSTGLQTFTQSRPDVYSARPGSQGGNASQLAQGSKMEIPVRGCAMPGGGDQEGEIK